jgi:hypothetical protein
VKMIPNSTRTLIWTTSSDCWSTSIRFNGRCWIGMLDGLLRNQWTMCFGICIDRKGLLAGVRFPLIQPSPAEVSESLARSMGSFWRYLNLFCVAMGREDLVRASEYFHQARSRLLQVVSASEAESAAMSPGVRRSYAQTFFQLERDSMMRAAEEACRLLGRLGRCLGPRHGVDYPDELEKVVRRQLANLSTSMPHDS